MLDSWIGYANAFILVYAINDRDSFEELKRKRDRIVKTKGKEDFVILMVGNKCDLGPEERKVPTQEAEELAQFWKIDFMEVSAKNQINVKESFLLVSRSLLLKTIKEEKSQTNEGKSKRCYCF